MKRIMIIGSGGSGKTTLAVKLGQLLGHPVLHLDTYYFGPAWEIPTVKEWENTVQKLISGDTWIMDGNYGGTMEIRITRADTIVFMDIPTPIKVWRVFWRTLRNHGKTRFDMAEGCVDRFEWQFFRYIVDYNKSRRPKILQRMNELKSSKKTIILRNKGEIQNFLNSL